VLFRTETLQSRLRWSHDGAAKKGIPSHDTSPDTRKLSSLEKLRNDFGQRRYDQVLEAWPQLDQYTEEAFSLAVTTLLKLGRPDDIGLFIAKAIANHPHLRPSLPEVIAAIGATGLDVRRQYIAAALRNVFVQVRNDLDPVAAKELLVQLARFNDETRTGTLLQELAGRGSPATSETLARVVQGFLDCKNLDVALGYLQQVLSAEGPEPLSLIVAAVRVSTEAAMNDEEAAEVRPRPWDVLETLSDFNIPAEAAILLLEWSCRQTPVDVEMAARVESKLRAAGPLPLAAYDPLVRVHASSLGDQKKAYACFSEFVVTAGDGNSPSERSIVAMILACLEARSGDLAAHIVKWAQHKQQCTLPIFSAAMRVLEAAKQPEMVCTLFETASAQGMVPDDAMYSQLIKFAAQAGRSDLARSLFGKVNNAPVQNYMSLMRACAQDGNAAQALKLLRELQQRQEVHTNIYNCALDVCVSCDDVAGAESVFEDMRASGHVDVVSFNILLKRHGGENASLPDADALIVQMRDLGLKPNTTTYNSLLSVAIAVGDFARAWRTISLMESSGVGVDAYTFSILFKGYKRNPGSLAPDDVDRALELIQQHSVQVDEVLVVAMLETCFILRDSMRLSAALETFKQKGWTVPKQCAQHTYCMLIKAHGQSRSVGEAWRLWDEVTREKGLIPNTMLYFQMIDVLLIGNYLDKAVSLFEEMKTTHRDQMSSHGFAVAYSLIIRGYAQRKDCTRAFLTYEEMKANNIKVSLVVFNTLIDACSRVGDIDSAAKMFRDMMEAQCVPDLITYSTLIKGYCFRGDLDEAMQLFAMMQKKGIRPDAIVFNSLLDGCAKKQKPALCEEIVCNMVEAGIKPSNYSASILVKLYGRCRDLDAAFRILEEMPVKYHFRPNVAVYTCLMSSCITNGRLDLAMDLRVRMVRDGAMPDEKTYSTLLRGALRSRSTDLSIELVNAALDQGGISCGERLLDEDLVRSVLLLNQRHGSCKQQLHHLQERLRAAGIHAQCRTPPEAGRYGRASCESWSRPDAVGNISEQHSAQKGGRGSACASGPQQPLPSRRYRR